MDVKSDIANTEAPVQESQAPAQDLIDLDGHSSFKYQGNTYTQDQFAEIYQGYEKYGETSKYVNEDKEFSSNVLVDIDKVLQNPSLQGEFKRVYPERYHAFLDRELNRSQQGRDSSVVNPQSQTTQLPKEVMDRLGRVDALEQRLYQADVAAASAKIDAILPSLMSKYELADEGKVLMEAEKVLGRGQKLTDAAWERLVREDHEKTQKRADKHYEAKLKSQMQKGQQGQDVGPGGATPGQSPVKPKTFAEAQAAMINHLRHK